MSQSGKKKRKTQSNEQNSSRVNVFERLGEERNERKYEQEKVLKIGKGEKSKDYSKHAHPELHEKKQGWKSPHKEQLYASQHHDLQDSKMKRHMQTELVQRIPSNEAHRYHSKHKMEVLGHKRKHASPSSSNLSSSMSPLRPSKHEQKRQRYQSPSPERYHPKNVERGRSRERRGKEPPPEYKEETALKQHRSSSKKYLENVPKTSKKLDEQFYEKRPKDQAEIKRSKHTKVKGQYYPEETFSKSFKHDQRPGGQRNASYQGEMKPYKQKASRQTYDTEESVSDDYAYVKQKKSKKYVVEDETKPKKRQKFEVHRQPSPQAVPLPVGEKKHKDKHSKKKSKEIVYEGSSDSQFFSPDQHYKESKKRVKQDLLPEESFSSDSVKKKVKKKKKAKEDAYVSPPLQQRKSKVDHYQEETMDEKVKKVKKRKRLSSQEPMPEKSPRKEGQHHLSKSEWPSSSSKPKRGKLEPGSYPDEPLSRHHAPSPRVEALLHRKRESPGSSSSRSESHHQIPTQPKLKLLQKAAEELLQRKEFQRRAQSGEAHRRQEVLPHPQRLLTREDVDRSYVKEEKRRMIPPEERPRQEDRAPSSSGRHRHGDKIQFHSDKKQPQYKEKVHRVPYDDRHVDRYEDKRSLPKAPLPSEPRRSSHHEERAFDRPPMKEQRAPPLLRREVQPEFKSYRPPSPSEHFSKRSTYRESSRYSNPPLQPPQPPSKSQERLYRSREPPPISKRPEEFQKPPMTQRVTSWPEDRDGHRKIRNDDLRDRKVTEKGWPQDERRPSDSRYRDPRERNPPRDSRPSKYPDPHFPPAPGSYPTYREVRQSGDQHKNARDMGLEVTIRDGGRNRSEESKPNKRPRTPPGRLVASYEVTRSRDQHPPAAFSSRSHSRSGSESRRHVSRSDTRNLSRDRSANRQRPTESHHPVHPAHAPRERHRREFPLKPYDATKPSNYRVDTSRLPKRDSRHPASSGRDLRPRDHQGASPRRQRRANGSEKREGKSRKGKSEKDPDEKQKREGEGPSPTKDDNTTEEAADVLDVDWKELAPEDQSKPAEKEVAPGSALKRFTPGNVLLRMGVSSSLLPDEVLSKVVQKCQEETLQGSASLVLDQGLGALNRSESLHRSARANIFASTSSTSRLTSFGDAEFRRKLLGINENLRFPARPPQLINAGTFSASMKHYMAKNHKIPVEVQ